LTGEAKAHEAILGQGSGPGDTFYQGRACAMKYCHLKNIAQNYKIMMYMGRLYQAPLVNRFILKIGNCSMLALFLCIWVMLT